MVQSPIPPLTENEWADGTSAHGRTRDPDTRYGQRTGMPKQLSIASPRFGSRGDDQVASNRPWFGRRVFRTMTRFFIAVLIGVGATLAWQAYGDAAREMVAARAPALAWLLPVSAAKSPAVPAVSPDLLQQLESLVSNLVIVRRSVEQLTAKQDQMAQGIAALQAVQEEMRQKLSTTPPSPAQQAGSNPASLPKPPQPRAQPLAVPRAPPPAGPLPR